MHIIAAPKRLVSRRSDKQSEPNFAYMLLKDLEVTVKMAYPISKNESRTANG